MKENTRKTIISVALIAATVTLALTKHYDGAGAFAILTLLYI
jgi:hypothetical protein